MKLSHGPPGEHFRRIGTPHREAVEESRTICILQDLQGPKIRTGTLKDHQPVVLSAGAQVTITARDVQGTAEVGSTTFKGLPAEVRPGSRILLSDGRIELRVRGVN